MLSTEVCAALDGSGRVCLKEPVLHLLRVFLQEILFCTSACASVLHLEVSVYKGCAACRTCTWLSTSDLCCTWTCPWACAVPGGGGICAAPGRVHGPVLYLEVDGGGVDFCRLLSFSFETGLFLLVVSVKVWKPKQKKMSRFESKMFRFEPKIFFWLFRGYPTRERADPLSLVTPI